MKNKEMPDWMIYTIIGIIVTVVIVVFIVGLVFIAEKTCIRGASGQCCSAATPCIQQSR